MNKKYFFMILTCYFSVASSMQLLKCMYREPATDATLHEQLLWAFNRNDVQKVRQYAYQININEAGPDGNTPIMHAAKNATHPEIMKILVQECNANALYINPQTGNCLWHEMIRNIKLLDPKTIVFLLKETELRHLINHKNNEGLTALDIAIRTRWRVYDILIRFGACEITPNSQWHMDYDYVAKKIAKEK